jgi:ribosome biogenesis GTPase
MDDEEATSGAKGGVKPKKNPSVKASYLAPEEANATVAEVFPKQCRIKADHPEPGQPPEYLCSYRRAGVVGQANTEIRERTPVAVGDRVLVTRTSPDSGVVEGVCMRRNRLMRPAPGREASKMQHVIAANVDAVVVVASLREPEFSPGLVDRFLVGAQAAGIDSILCMTKLDLLESGAARTWDNYRELGFEVIEVSVRQGEGMEVLRKRLQERTVVFCGRSGAGKTSLLRVLLGSNVGKVGEVSAATGKGKHTTTSAVLLGGPGKSQWIDTPGVREFGLADVSYEALAGFFPEFQGVICTQAGCHHAGEEGCGVTEFPRYSSYLRIFQSLRSGEN